MTWFTLCTVFIYRLCHIFVSMQTVHLRVLTNLIVDDQTALTPGVCFRRCEWLCPLNRFCSGTGQCAASLNQLLLTPHCASVETVRACFSFLTGRLTTTLTGWSSSDVFLELLTDGQMSTNCNRPISAG